MRALFAKVFSLLLCFVFLLLTAASPLAEKNLTTRISFGKDDTTLILALQMLIPPGYHAYSHETVDTGRPTELDLSIDKKEQSDILYPKGAAQQDLYAPEHSVFVYAGETYLFARLPESVQGKSYHAELSLLLCSARHCLPINSELHGVIPTTVKALAEQPWHDLYRQAASASHTMPPLPARPGINDEQKPLPPPAAFAVTFQPEYATHVLEVSSISKALLLGLLAGLLLNFMPCVLPVLTFKMSSLLLIGKLSQAERIHTFRTHNLCFAAGIITFFSILAAMLGMADLIWGQLFQSETMILIMLVLVFLMGLSLLGVFSLPIIDLKFHEKTSHPLLQSYLTGIMTTLLATPCSGPLLGGVLGWAFTQPFMVLICVFWCIGLGMALPYFLFSLWPKAVHLLPKTGPWMNVLEHLAGFLLIGTALYLLSILPADKYIPVLFVLLMLALAAWLWGQYCGPDASRKRKYALGTLGLVLLVLSMHWLLKPQDPPMVWQNFSSELFTQKLGQKMLLIEFTADWCPNCKFMEKTVLTGKTLSALQSKYDFELIRADLTQANAEATYLLTALGSRSIPLTAIFPQGDKATSPIVLRDIYDTELLEESFARALSKSQ
ncbi:MAG: thioredoxin family protein [Desulfovibrio sp.]|nr:thioredoxin family protein [Desulfovibrio sp.]